MIKHIIKFLLPPFILYPFIVLYRYAKYLKHRFIDRKTFLRFSLKAKPESGYYPNHIRGYVKCQTALAKNLKNPRCVVIFFNVIQEWISGGMMSIDRLAVHSQEYAAGFTVIQSGLPIPLACIKNPYYDWGVPVIDFKYIIKYVHPKTLRLNIPECFVQCFLNDLTAGIITYLRAIPNLSINILNQNDRIMPNQHSIEELRTLANGRLTITAAHRRYCTKEKEIMYGAPVYMLTPFLPNFYRLNFNQKENIIIISDDAHHMKERIIEQINNNLPCFKTVIIQNMHFEDYKKLVSKAKFAISFGEGFDGYFLEPYLSNSIGIAVRNNVFFPKDFKHVPTVYESWEQLYRNIITDIKKWAYNEKLYCEIQSGVEAELSRFCNNEQSEKDLAAYYERLLSTGG
ncbi:hypothetical protein FACS189494_04380 [Spirochaetia bacterium]|nr:hypothetical protein FACS189494_04380 [Spirochaetia bacterium]